MTDRELLLSLLRCALWDAPLPEHLETVAGEQWNSMYALAQAQGVHVLLLGPVQKLPQSVHVPASLATDLMAQAFAAQKNFQLHMATVQQMTGFFKEAGVHGSLLKGVAVSRMYPAPARRLCGDIDWYFPTAQDWDGASQVMMEKGVSLTLDSDADVHYSYNGIVIEHHRHWNHLYSQRRLGRLDSDEKWLFMLYSHLWRHIIGKGAGMRQVCDQAMACRFFSERIDRERFMVLVRKCRAGRWVRLIDSMLVEKLGMPEEYAAFGCRRGDIDRLMDIIFDAGDLGNGNGFFSGMAPRLYFGMKYTPYSYIRRFLLLVLGRINRIKD